MIALNFPNPVQEERFFYGRRGELERIGRSLRAHIPSVILGERRIGKTSLQNVALQGICRAEEPRFIPVWVEPRGIASLDDLGGAIIQSFSYQTGKNPAALDLLDRDWPFHLDYPNQIDPVIDQMGGQDRLSVFLLCVDEFDEILRNAGAEIERIDAFLHHLARPDSRLVPFLTMTRMPDTIEGSYSTPFTELAEVIDLGPWEKAELHALLVDLLGGGPAAVSAHFTDRVFDISGGHPFFAKLLLANLLERQSGQLEGAALDEALRDSLSDPRVAYPLENLYHVHFNEVEKELLLLVAKRDHGVLKQELKAAGTMWLTAAGRLVERHYFSEDRNRFDLRIAYLRPWLRNWVEFEEELDHYSSLRRLLAEPPEIEVDKARGQVRVRGRTIRLSVQEFHIMCCLAEGSGQLVNRERLVQTVWRTEQGVTDQTVDTAIYRLRRKIEDHGQYLETVAGQGFILHRAVLLNRL